MSAALWETFSSELPVSWSSSFWFFDASTSTPGNIVTRRMIFSPMKFLDGQIHQSTTVLVLPHEYSIPDFHVVQASLRILFDVHVDWKMCIDVSHLVLEAFRDPNNQVVDNSFHRAECRNIFSSAMV